MVFKLLFCLTLVGITFELGITSGKDPTITNTNLGPIIGFRAKLATGKQVDHYLGIPYAKPPVGTLRFKHPVPPDPWEEGLKTQTLPNACEQRPVPGTRIFKPFKPYHITTPSSEDCLKLNVWVPYPRQADLAIIIWIHGGGHVSGSCSQPIYDGKILSGEENVIVVCVNYRLSTLGFLFLDNNDIPGNAGFYDQLLAIKWVKDNARNFGGDPNSITVMGESSGASSAGLHLLSPLNDNLFSRAILQSGTVISIWASSNRSTIYNVSAEIAETVGCPVSKGSKELVSCLQDVNAISLVEAVLFVPESFDETLRPFSDEQIITSNLAKSLESGNISGNFSILIGNNKHEGSTALFAAVPSRLSLSQPRVHLNKEDFQRSLKKFMYGFNDLALKSAEFLYTNWSNSDGNVFRETEEFATDFGFTCRSEKMAQQMTRSGHSVYSYVFNHKPDVKEWPEWMGVTHTAEIEFVFGEPLDASQGYSSEDMDVSRRVMRYWANFARTGNPNVNADGTNTVDYWPKYEDSSREFITISTNETLRGKGLRAQFCHFWNHFVPEVLDKRTPQAQKI